MKKAMLKRLISVLLTNHYTDADGNRLYQTRTGAEWGESRILPTNDRMNMVPLGHHIRADGACLS